MSIKKYYATKDNTITNAFKADLSNRGTGSNMGASDILEVFSIYGQASSSASGSTAELSRVLMQFPATGDSGIQQDRSDGKIPASGSVNFYLRVFNARHSQTLPRDFTMTLLPISSSWEEGFGLDMESYQDVTLDKSGSNWVNNQTRVAATATITIVDLGSNTTDINQLHGTTGFTITDSAGNAIEYYFDKAGAAGSTGTSTADGIVIQVNGMSAATDVAAQVEAALNSANGHGNSGKETITISRTDNVINLTHDAKGPDGNNIIDPGSTPTPTYIQYTGFSGGAGIWTKAGGDFHTSSIYEASFVGGTEDIEVDITALVEEWITGSSNDVKGAPVGYLGKDNYGVGITLHTGTFESYYSGSDASDSTHHVIPGTSVYHNLSGPYKSYYTKRFFSRTSEHYYKRPCIEARWDSSRKDDRGNLYASSSLAATQENLFTLYLYNSVRGQLRNIPDIGDGDHIYAKFYTSASGGDIITGIVGSGTLISYENAVTGGWKETGIYTASFAFNNTASVVYDVWFTGSEAEPSTYIEYHTGSFSPKSLQSQDSYINPKYATTINNLKSVYTTNETARFRLYTRKKDWSPTIYSKATTTPASDVIEKAYYKIYRAIDELEIIDYGTGSAQHTQLSYDISGSYFDLDMSLFEKEYQYGIKFLYYINGSYYEQPEAFKFRVE